MAGKRLLTLKGHNFVISDRDHSPEQLFIYDQETQSIKAYSHQSHSLSIEHSGRNRNLIAHKSEIAWWQHFIFSGKNLKNERGLMI